MPFTVNKGVRLHWDETGSGTPVLLVMGHRYSSAMWYPAIPALSAKHRVIWFDNRGAGETDAPTGFKLEDMADDAFAVMDAAGVDTAHIYGVSMGGVIVQDMALRRPERVRSLIVGCSGPLTPDKPRAPKFLSWLIHNAPWLVKLIAAARGGGAGYGSRADPATVANDKAMIAKDKYSVKGVLAQSEAINGYRTTREALAGLTLPAMVLHGDEDGTVPIKWGRELADILPNSRFLEIKGVGHNFMMVDLDSTNAAVLDFIGEVDAAAKPRSKPSR